MKKLHLILLSAFAAFAPRLRTRYATANAAAAAPASASPELADLQAQFAAMQTQITEQNATIATLEASAKTTGAAALPPISSEIALLSKGAGVKVEDVRWRVAQGLTPQQAVQAASLQVARDAARETGTKNARKAKSKP